MTRGGEVVLAVCALGSAQLATSSRKEASAKRDIAVIGLLLDRSLPELNGARHPSFGTGSDSRTEAMTDPAESVKLHFRPRPPQCCDSSFHHRWRSDAVLL